MKKIQCEQCEQAKYGEPLWNYNGEILCAYCIAARAYEDSRVCCEECENCNDKTFGIYEDTKKLKQRIAELEEENKQLRAVFNADNKIKINSLKGFQKLQKENVKFKEQLKRINKDFN